MTRLTTRAAWTARLRHGLNWKCVGGLNLDKVAHGDPPLGFKTPRPSPTPRALHLRPFPVHPLQVRRLRRRCRRIHRPLRCLLLRLALGPPPLCPDSCAALRPGCGDGPPASCACSRNWPRSERPRLRRRAVEGRGECGQYDV